MQPNGVPTQVCPAPLPSLRALTLSLIQEAATPRNACPRGQTDLRTELSGTSGASDNRTGHMRDHVGPVQGIAQSSELPTPVINLTPLESWFPHL